MAYFYDKISGVSIAAPTTEQKFTFGAGTPVFQRGSVSHGQIVTLGASGDGNDTTAITFLRNLTLPGLILTGSASFQSNVTFTGSVLNASSANINAASFNGIELIENTGSFAIEGGTTTERALTVNGNVNIGASNGRITISSTVSGDKTLNLNLGTSAFTFNSGSGNQVAYYGTNALLALAPPSTDGTFVLSQVKTGTSISVPSWIQYATNTTFSSGVNGVKIDYVGTGLGQLYILESGNTTFINNLVGEYDPSLYSQTGSGTLASPYVLTFTNPIKMNRFIADTTNLNPALITTSGTADVNSYYTVSNITWPVTQNSQNTYRITLNTTGVMSGDWVNKRVNFGTLGGDSTSVRDTKYYQLPSGTTSVLVEIILQWTNGGSETDTINKELAASFVWNKNSAEKDTKIRIPVSIEPDIITGSNYSYPVVITKSWATNNKIQLSSTFYNGYAAWKDAGDERFGGLIFQVTPLN